MLGGAGTYALELAKGFLSLGHEIDVLTSNRGLEASKHVDNFDIKVYRKDWSPRFWFLSWRRYLKSHLKRHHYDGVVFANQGAIIIGSKLGKITTPYLLTLHGSERYSFLADKYSLKTRILVNKKKLAFFLEKANAVVCVSDDLLNDVKKLISSKVELVKIPLGISNIFHASMTEANRTSSSVNIICTARFVVGKGQDKVVRAFRSFRENHEKNAHLYFIGNGSEMENIKNLCSNLGLDTSVTFMGLQSRNDIAKIYQNMDVFIMLSSFKETFGLVYLEAMFAGLPVIGTNLGAVCDLITNDYNGYLIEENMQTEDMIVEALISAVSKRDILGNNSIKFAQKFTNIAMAESHLKYFQ
jgi:glycosyltransferase involved in cell wall biosynthesis